VRLLVFWHYGMFKTLHLFYAAQEV
jgi:hypothetical protein